MNDMASITTYIENLRQKPEHIRRRAAFWWSFGVTAIIVLFWLASFTNIGIGSFSSSSASGSAATSGQTASAADAGITVTPGTSLASGIADFAGDVWSYLSGPKKVSFAEVKISAGKD